MNYNALSARSPAPIVGGFEPIDLQIGTTLFEELCATIFMIFVTGPLKVFLDIKRGQTSLKDMTDEF